MDEDGRPAILPTLYQQQIAKSKYARWRDDLGRRESWPETVERYIDAMDDKVFEQTGSHLSPAEYEELYNASRDHAALGSMRSVMTAGAALTRDNVAGYNCAYMAVNRIQAFDEALYILCCGTGVGFSVERQYTSKLPDVPDELFESDTMIVVQDSKQGWAKALRSLISLLYAGEIAKWDTSRVRPAGARLKTFGGKASGPGPLIDLFNYVVETFRGAEGRKLTSLECHGIMCKVGDIVVVGGVRRSALISLSDPDDDRMRDCKQGQWSDEHPEYMLANNSAVWSERPSVERFMEEWTALIKSKSGERGIINRAGMQRHIAANGRRDPNYDFGTNPCSEILLRDRQFCNLSEVVVRADDTFETLVAKVRLATTLGCIQSCFTNFRYLSAQWRRNCEEERLLGVSLTGIMDHEALSDEGIPWGWDGPADLEVILACLKQVAIETAEVWSKRLGITMPTAITCVKPSGTVSQLVNAASGIHPRWAPYYVRTNRMSKSDPVAQFLAWSGVPVEDELFHPDTTSVFSYPIKSPEGAVTRDDRTAIEQLRLWMIYAKHWCEHKPSITVYVREEEWLEVGAFVYEHFDHMSGVSFLPHSDHTYQQAPYQEIDKAEYERLIAQMPDELVWDSMTGFEAEDQTENMKTLACSAGGCEI